jgi:transcriptional regulator with XRE-family HTH domain
MEKFASNLRKRAEELGISNAEAARRSGLSERRYGNYVTGRREPDLATLVRIAKTLETTPNDLLGLGDESVPSHRKLLKDRLKSAANAMDDNQLEMAVIQAEALVSKR